MIYIYPSLLKILSFHHTQTKISHEICCLNVVCGVFIRRKQFPDLKLLRTLTMKGCSEFLNLFSCGWFCVWFSFSQHGVFHNLTQVFCFRIKPTCLFKIFVFMCINYKLTSAKLLTAFQGNTNPQSELWIMPSFPNFWKVFAGAILFFIVLQNSPVKQLEARLFLGKDYKLNLFIVSAKIFSELTL